MEKNQPFNLPAIANRALFALVSALALSMSAVSAFAQQSAPPLAADNGTSSRPQGSNDYDTAAALSKTLHSPAGEAAIQAQLKGGSHGLLDQRDAADDLSQRHAKRKAALENPSTQQFIDATASIGAPEIAHHVLTNHDYQQFLVTDGAAFAKNAEAAPYILRARSDMTTATDGVGNCNVCRRAVAQHRAAVSMETDLSLTIDLRFEAFRYLAAEARAMTHD